MNEKENTVTINGLLGMNDSDLLGKVTSNPSILRKALVNAQAARPSSTVVADNSRTAIQSRINLFDEEIKKGLANKTLQLCDAAVMVVKSISGKSEIKMFADADTKKVGVCMVNGAKLEKGEPMLVNEIILLSGVGSGTTEDAATINATQFGRIADELVGGEIEIKCGGKIILPKTSLEVFANGFIDGDGAFAFGNGERRIGSFKLDNPKLLPTQKTIEVNIEWGSTATTNTFLKAVLKGTKVTTF